MAIAQTKKYYRNGQAIRESMGTDTDSKAKRLLKEREGHVVSGQPILPRADRIRYEEVAQGLRSHYKTSGSHDTKEADFRLKRLDRFFTGRKIAAMGLSEAAAYADKRHESGASNGTINRDLTVLNRALKPAYENGKLLRLPIIRKLRENGPRQGFLEPAQHEAVRRRLPEYLRLAAGIAYAFGWRVQSEILTPERRRLDLEAGTLRLEPGTTKTKEGRLAVYLLTGRHHGRRIGEFKKARGADPLRVRPLQHCQPRRSSEGHPEAGGHNGWI
ncbi:MAG: hypothetical protein ACE5JN_00400 [Candidatus Methylomirabilia bacterium]